MNTFFKIFVILLLLTFSSCTMEPYEYTEKYFIINESNEKISFEFFSHIDYEPFVLFSGNEKEYLSSLKGSFTNFFPYEAIDSIRVTFNDEISIIHGSTLYNVNRSLLLESSFTQTIDDEYLREYKYVFTEDDYIEALDHQ